jgi:hypothetical protein
MKMLPVAAPLEILTRAILFCPDVPVVNGHQKELRYGLRNDRS